MDKQNKIADKIKQVHSSMLFLAKGSDRNRVGSVVSGTLHFLYKCIRYIERDLSGPYENTQNISGDL